MEEHKWYLSKWHYWDKISQLQAVENAAIRTTQFCNNVSYRGENEEKMGKTED